MEDDVMETAEKQTEDRRSKNIKKTFNRYKIPALMIIVFIAAAYITGSVSNSLTGAVIDKLESENTNLKALVSSEQSSKQSEKSNLELEKISLQRELDDVKDLSEFYSGLINDVSEERLKTLTTPYGFQITWDKYVSTDKLMSFEWVIFIKNTDLSEKTYNLDLNLKSNPAKVFEKEPSTGSLVLEPGNSGSLAVDFVPKNRGYAIFEITVNNRYVGDLIIFSL